MLRDTWSVILAAVLVVTTAGAVVADPPERVDGADRPVREQPAGHSPVRYLRMLDSFKKEIVGALDLDEELAGEVSELFDEHAAGIREGMEDLRQQRRDNAERIRELVRELREAQANEDPERADELRQEIVALRQRPAGATPDHEELFDSVRELLDEEQIETFDEYARRFDERLSGPEEDAAGSIRHLRRALDVVELSAEQRAQTRDLLSATMREVRSARHDAERVKELESAARDDIIELLDDEQAEKFQEALLKLAREEGKSPKREKRDRGSRPAKPERGQADDSDADGHAEEADESLDADTGEDEPDGADDDDADEDVEQAGAEDEDVEDDDTED